MSLIFIYYPSIFNIKSLFHVNPPVQSTHASACRVVFDYPRAEKIYFQFRSLNVCVFLSLGVSQHSREVTDNYLGV